MVRIGSSKALDGVRALDWRVKGRGTSTSRTMCKKRAVGLKGLEFKTRAVKMISAKKFWLQWHPRTQPVCHMALCKSLTWIFHEGA